MAQQVYAPTFAERPITVVAVTITLEIDRRWACPDDTVVFSGRLLYDGIPQPNKRIIFALRRVGHVTWIPFVETYPDADGYFRFDWKVLWAYGAYELVGYDCEFVAIDADTGTLSDIRRLAIAYRTRMAITAPPEVGICESFSVEAWLEHESEPDVWTPLAGQTVRASYNGVLIDERTTDLAGHVVFPAHIATSGVYTLLVEYAGTLPAGSPVYAPAKTALSVLVSAPLYVTLGFTVSPIVTGLVMTLVE